MDFNNQRDMDYLALTQEEEKIFKSIVVSKSNFLKADGIEEYFLVAWIAILVIAITAFAAKEVGFNFAHAAKYIILILALVGCFWSYAERKVRNRNSVVTKLFTRLQELDSKVEKS